MSKKEVRRARRNPERGRAPSVRGFAADSARCYWSGVNIHRCCWFVLFLLSSLAQAQEYQGKTLVRARVIADTATVEGGKPFRVGVLYQIVPGWHMYWKYPGDAGLPTRIDWTLPPGFSAGELQWPTPKVDDEEGGLQVYVYADEVLLCATVTPPAKVSGPVEIGAKTSWLVCEKLCVPGSAELQIKLPGEQGNSGDVFARYASRWPKTEPPFALQWQAAGKTLAFASAGWKWPAEPVFFFPHPADGVLIGHPTAAVQDGSLKVEIPLLDGSQAAAKINGVLQAGDQAWEIGAPAPAQPASTASLPKASTLTLLPALLFGFLGGLILNLMPCVLPVISLKMFSFVKQAGESRQRIFRMGLAFAAGMFAWFLGLAVVLLIVRSTGTEITWAQQFQNPWFNIGISLLIFLFALNLLGVYEITLPGAAATKLADTGDGYGGAFFQGMFATILGTPCTAPYLGTTLAFALTQPALALLSVFAAIAFGMSAPYLLLCANPAWMKYLPKPGLWMVRLKEFMGFLLLATLLWFVWIVGRQAGLPMVVFLGALLVLSALAAWIYGTFLTPVASSGVKKFGVASLLLVLVLISVAATTFRPVPERNVSTFTAQLNQALATDRPVFVDFTADWCLSCKVNKRTSIDPAAVQAAFKQKNVLFLEADWTNGDPEITKVLKQYGRAGVPLYLVYPRDRSVAPALLPELLTPQLVLDALQKVDG